MDTKINKFTEFFNIPGLIGIDGKYPTIKEYLKETYEYNSGLFDSLKWKLKNIEQNYMGEIEEKIYKN